MEFDCNRIFLRHVRCLGGIPCIGYLTLKVSADVGSPRRRIITNGFGGFKVPTREATIWDSGNNTASFSTRSTIGEAVARTLLHPEKTENRYIYISTLETCQNDILASLKRVTGDAEWKVTNVTSKEKIRQGKEMIEKGQFLMGSGTLALTAAYRGGYGGDFKKEGKLANELLGLPEEELDVVIKKILETTGQL